MSSRRVKALLLACTGIGALCVTSIDANAGGFALREQSAYGQGSSFAGIAAGGALSAMFWNPAIITQFKGKTVEQDVSGILPYSSHSYTTATLAAIPAFANAPSNSGISAVVPSGYSSWQINDKLWVGMSVNAPFGLAVRFPYQWAGSAYGQRAKVETYNFAPTVAYKINDMISVAFGVQAQYMKVSYDAFLATNPLIGSVNGAGWGWGWTAGVTFTPLPKTQIGIGYRSAIDQKINGSLDVPAALKPVTTFGSVNLNLPLPDMVTVGLRQGIGDRFTLLAGIEWSNWSRIGTPRLLQPNGAQAFIGATPVVFPFQYSDGWYYSLGGEYVLNPAWTVRAGIAYEKSPITDNVRTPRLPDNDRMWYSVGATFKPATMKGFTFDAGYSYINVKSTPLCLGVASGCPTNPWSGATTYIGSASSDIHIFSLAVRYQWDADPPAKVGIFKAK